MSDSPTAGWYPDPHGSSAYRWWNGEEWTDHLHQPEPSGEPEPVPLDDRVSSGGMADEQPADDPFDLSRDPFTLSDDAAAQSADATALNTDNYPVLPEPDYTMMPAGTVTAVALDDRADSGTAAAGGKGRRPVGKILAIAGAGLLVLVGGAAAAFALLSGSGAQPESAMPANTIAFVKVDLNPSASQKVNLVRFLSSNLPADAGAHLSSTSTDPVGDLVTSSGMLDGTGYTWADFTPWLGDRAAIAVLPAPAGSSDPAVPAVFIAVTDETAMTDFLSRATSKDSGKVPAHAMVRDGYAVLAQDQGTVDMVIASPQSLSESPSYQGSVAQAGTGQFLVGWADLSAVQGIAGALGDEFGSPGKDLPVLTGQEMITVTVEPDMVNVSVFANDVMVDGKPLDMGPSAVTNDLASLPGTTIAAYSAAALGPLLRSQGALNPDLAAAVRDYLPGTDINDIYDALSTTVTVAVTEGGSPTDLVVFGRFVESTSATVASVHTLAQQMGAPVDVTARTVAGVKYGYVTVPDMGEPAAGGGTLADSPVFQKVVPEPGAMVMFVDLSRVWAYVKASDPSVETFPQVTGVGVVSSVSPDDPRDGQATIRVAFTPTG